MSLTAGHRKTCIYLTVYLNYIVNRKAVQLHNEDSSHEIIMTSNTVTMVMAHEGAVLIQYCELLLTCELNIIIVKTITRDDLGWTNEWDG